MLYALKNSEGKAWPGVLAECAGHAPWVTNDLVLARRWVNDVHAPDGPFFVCVWSPVTRSWERLTLDRMEMFANALGASMRKANEVVQAVIANAGDQVDPDLVKLQHRMAELLREPEGAVLHVYASNPPFETKSADLVEAVA